MKKFNFLFLAFLLVFLSSCSSDDSDNNDNEEVVSNHLPLAIGNSWTYNNETLEEDGSTTSTQETLSVSSSNEEAGVTYFTLTSNADLADQGFVTGILTNGELTKAENQLIFDGDLDINLANFGLTASENLVIPLSNIILYDIDANTNEVLTENDDNTFTQEINIQGSEIPFTFEYTITSTQGDFLEAYTVNEDVFEDVITANITVNIEIYASFFGIELPVLAPQDAIIITNYYANNVGMIYSETAVNYEFEELNLPTFPELPDYSVNYYQELESYTIVE